MRGSLLVVSDDPEGPVDPEDVEDWDDPEDPEDAFCASLAAGALAGVPSETATSSGPFTPGPKLSEIRSYARRAVVEVDSAAVSCCPRVSDSSGIVSGSRIASAASPATSGCLAIVLAQRDHRPSFVSASGRRSRWAGRTRSE